MVMWITFRLLLTLRWGFKHLARHVDKKTPSLLSIQKYKANSDLPPFIKLFQLDVWFSAWRRGGDYTQRESASGLPLEPHGAPTQQHIQ